MVSAMDNLVPRTFSLVCEMDSGANGPDGWRHCVLFLVKTLNLHGTSLHPGVKWVPKT